MGYFTDYPKHVFLILSNEFCERFSYYGMKAILVAYFTTALRFDDDTATALYHSFTVVCYFTPIIGAMIADGWLGKFKTILYLSLIYSLGNIVMTVTAIPIDGEFINWTPFIGLAIIAFGTGGIKPCVSAFGGDQFKPGQERQKDSFFSLFYMAINVGSLLSTVITPLIRNNVRCFGQECYAVAFAIPAGLMLVAIVLFVIGSRWYTKVPPGESILARMFKCIWTAIRGKCGCCTKGPKEKKDHWLDYAEDKFDKRFIADLKDVMSVCWLFLPLPVFWALFDQQGSRWTLQAKSLNGNIGSAVMPYDMMQVMNALLVVLFVPLLESVIYPCLNKLKIPNRPLQRMGLGMVLAGTAFVLAGVLQVFIDNESPTKVAGTPDIRFNFLNSGPCQVQVSPWHTDMSAGVDIPAYENTDYFITPYNPNTVLEFTPSCPSGGSNEKFTLSMTLAEISLDYQVVITGEGAVWYRQYMNDFTPDYEASVRIYNAMPDLIEEVSIEQNKLTSFFNISANNFSSFDVFNELDKFSLSVIYQGKPYQFKNPAFEAENGAVYTVMVYQNITTRAPEAKQLLEIKPRGISIFLQVPQYAIMTFGECLFSVTGLGFAYTQAAPSMKSILTSIWLLTVAIGNVVVVIVAETGSALSQMAEFFLFAGIMFATTVVFIIMCFFYKYVEPRDDWSSDDTSSTSSGSSRSDRSNDDVSKMKKQDAMIAEETGVVLKKVKDVGDDGEKKKKLDSDSDSDSVKSAGSLTKF